MSVERTKITVDDLYRITHVEDPRISPDGQWIAYVQLTVDKFDNGYKRNIWLVSTSGGKPLQLTRSGKDSNPRWSPDGKLLAFVSGRDEKPQIYLLPVGEPGGEARALTQMPNGANSPAWSPDGTMMAFLAPMNSAEREREDSRIEEPKPSDKLEGKHRKERKEQDETKRWDPRWAERLPYRTGTSFLSDRFAQIYVAPVAEGLSKDESRPRRLTDLDADHFAPQWTPDGQYLLTARIGDPKGDEPWRWSNLYRIRVSDGESLQLTDETYSSLAPLPSPDGKWVAFIRYPRERLSERMTRLAIIPLDGGEPRDLNQELDRSVGDFKWMPNSAGMLFTAQSWGDLELYHVDLASGEVDKVVAGRQYIEQFDVHPEAGIAYTSSTAANPSELFYRASSLDASTQLTEVNKAFLESVIVQEMHELRWKSPSGVEIQGWYLLPVGYQEGEQYPLALNIHGGPHVMWGPGMKSMWHEWQYHAAQGYVSFFCNPRGAEGCGEAFIMSLHGNWGPVAMDDIMTGVDTLLGKGFVDPKRLAITGGSYGGYMTAWITAHSDRFISAVAQRGVYNLLSFSGYSDIPSFIPTEFGIEPWDDPTTLWEHSPLAHAHKIKTPLLIIHSEADYRVPIAEGEQLFTYVKRSGGTVKLLRFPRDGHEMSRSGEPEHRVASLTEMVKWFNRYCYPDNASG